MDFKKIIEQTLSQSFEHIVPLLIITLVFVGVSIVSLGILAPVMMAGYTQALLNMVRSGTEPSPKDLFSHMGLFLPLLFFTIVLVIVISVGFMLLVIPGILLILAAAFYLIFLLPLMTDKGYGVFDAAKESISMVQKANFVEHMVFVVVYLVVQSLGGSSFVGTLVTMPLSTVFLVKVYGQMITFK